MVTISAGTLLGVIALVVTLIVAAFGAVYKLGTSLGNMNSALNNLAEATKRLEGLPERVARLEERAILEE